MVVLSINAFNVQEAAAFSNWGCFWELLQFVNHKLVWTSQTRFSLFEFWSCSAQKVLLFTFLRNFIMLPNIEYADLTVAWFESNIFPLVFYKFSVNVFDWRSTYTRLPYKTGLLTWAAKQKEMTAFCVDWRCTQNAFPAFLVRFNQDKMLRSFDGLSFSNLFFLSFQFLQLLVLLFEFLLNFGSLYFNFKVLLFGVLFGLIMIDIFEDGVLLELNNAFSGLEFRNNANTFTINKFEFWEIQNSLIIFLIGLRLSRRFGL